jgi:hypothetical protein
MALVLRIDGLASGARSPFDGKLLKEYDPGRDGTDPTGQPMLAHVVCTDDPAEAMRFEDAAEVHRLWTLIDPREPVRPDGGLNRPLTAFTVSAEPLP